MDSPKRLAQKLQPLPWDDSIVKAPFAARRCDARSVLMMQPLPWRLDMKKIAVNVLLIATTIIKIHESLKGFITARTTQADNAGNNNLPSGGKKKKSGLSRRSRPDQSVSTRPHYVQEEDCPPRYCFRTPVLCHHAFIPVRRPAPSSVPRYLFV